MHDALFIANQQFEAVCAHRGEMRSACDQADIGSCERQLHAEIAADRSGAVDTDFHAVLQTDWPELRGPLSWLCMRMGCRGLRDHGSSPRLEHHDCEQGGEDICPC